MKTPSSSSTNQSVQQAQRTAAAQRLADNKKATTDYVAKVYPNEKKWISNNTAFQKANEFTKDLTLPPNVSVAKSRIPQNKNDHDILKKELYQAKILSSLGNVIFFTPEPGSYRHRVTDAVVNGVPYEFRTITGTSRRVEKEFGDAKRKGNSINVFMNIDSKINRDEVRRRIVQVLERHPDYTGKIIVSMNGGRPHFWDTSSFR
ncbi:hypothetical protein AGMMS50230_00300 [Spirochaetia bacterium]|nr:hypothetical protein AGMMS50230_00300 [Spirochaetia bacterium]